MPKFKVTVSPKSRIIRFIGGKKGDFNRIVKAKDRNSAEKIVTNSLLKTAQEQGGFGVPQNKESFNSAFSVKVLKIERKSLL